MKKILLSIIVSIIVVINADLVFAQTPAAEFLIHVSQNSYQVGDQISVLIDIDTHHNEVVSADILAVFDPDKLKLEKIDNSNNPFPNTTSGIKEGTNNTIYITSYINAGTRPYSGHSNFSVLKFRAKKAGQTCIDIVFEPGQTVESNIINTSGNDILNMPSKDCDLSLDISGSTPPACEADLTGDHSVGLKDFYSLMSSWISNLFGSCGSDCLGDLNKDGKINSLDFSALISQWGPCPN